MSTPKLVMASKLIVPLVQSLQVADSEGPLSNACYGYCTVQGMASYIRHEEFSLLIAADPLTAALNLVSNTTVVFAHPSIFIALETDPTVAVQKLWGIMAGQDLADLRTSPAIWPSANEAASDVWKAPLYFCRATSMTLGGLEKLAAKVSSRGIVDLYIDCPQLLRLSPRKQSTHTDFPEIGRALRDLARTHHLAIIGAHTPELSLAGAAEIADSVVRFESFGQTTRLALLRQGQTKPRFLLAKREACARLNDLIRHPWGDTEKRFEAARQG